MTPLEIIVNGSSSTQRPAELAILTITISHESESQQEVSDSVRTTVNEAHSLLKQHILLTPTGKISANSPVTIFTTTRTHTSSYQPSEVYSRDGKDKVKVARKHSGTTTMVATFRDFLILGQVTAALAKTEFVRIDDVSWILTDVTKKLLASESHKEAIKDAISKAEDFANVLGRKVVCSFVSDQGTTSRARTKMAALDLRPVSSDIVSEPRTGYLEGLGLEPQDVEFSSKVQAKFVGVE